MHELSQVGPAFVEMAHRIVWCVVATVGANGAPRTRVLHPIWEWDGAELHGWIATSPNSPKASDLAEHPRVSLTYWHPDQDTCTADCVAAWQDDPEDRRRGWDRFADGPEPVGFDPALIPQWTDPDAEEFGILHLMPTRLRLMPGSLMLRGEGELLTWSAASGG